MDRLLALVGALLLGIVLFLGWRLHKVSDFIDRQSQTIGTQKQQLADKNSLLLAVDLMARANDSLQLGLQQRHAEREADTARRDQRFKELKNENPEVKRWADARLPDDVIRLQQRPAITGSEGYHAYLSGSDALHSASQSATDQR